MTEPERIKALENPVLHDLYYGRIKPFENKPERLDKQKEIAVEIEKEKCKLEKNLSTEDRQCLQALIKLHDDLMELVGFENFSYGYKLATRIMTESFIAPISK